MWQFFADYPWFTLFIVIAAGPLFGMVRFGPVKLGAAGVLVCRLPGQSRPRTMGPLAGYVGNAAITAYADSRVSDSRVNTGYATLFALAILVKIVCVRFIVGL